MKYFLLFLLLAPAITFGQVTPFGTAQDSTTFTFSAGDSLVRHQPGVNVSMGGFSGDTVLVSLDTTGCRVWEIGSTLKPVFSNGVTRINGIMTDTAVHYPKNANDYFVLKIGYLVPNVVIDIWHKYATDSMHAGGIVEYSFDTGATWMNVASCPLINKQNYYSGTDTLITGQPAFTGHSSSQQLSRLQFVNCEIPGIRVTATACSYSGFVEHYYSGNNIYLRFRFVSDSTTDSLSGWIIDSIKIESPGCVVGPGYVPQVSNHYEVSVYPNPAGAEVTVTSTEKINTLVITNILGQQVYRKADGGEQETADISRFPAGFYFVKVNGSVVKNFVKQ